MQSIEQILEDSFFASTKGHRKPQMCHIITGLTDAQIITG